MKKFFLSLLRGFKPRYTYVAAFNVRNTNEIHTLIVHTDWMTHKLLEMKNPFTAKGVMEAAIQHRVQYLNRAVGEYTLQYVGKEYIYEEIGRIDHVDANDREVAGS